MRKLLGIAALAVLPVFIQGSLDPMEQARELGKVKWARTLEPALQQSAADHKPVLLLFQEVPG
jgi:hypothetical protein